MPSPVCHALLPAETTVRRGQSLNVLLVMESRAAIPLFVKISIEFSLNFTCTVEIDEMEIEKFPPVSVRVRLLKNFRKL